MAVLAFALGVLAAVLALKLKQALAPLSRQKLESVELYKVKSSPNRDYLHEMAKTNEVIDLFVSNLPIVLWVFDHNLELMHTLGPTVHRRTGVKPDDLWGLNIHQLFQTEDRNHPSISAHMRALEGESVSFEIEWSGRFFAAHVHPWRDSLGNVQGCIGVAIDNTAGKQHLDRLLSMTKELERSNEDLQRFSFAVSHDLKEPVRIIASYMQLMERDKKLGQDETFRRYGSVVTENATRMGSLVDSLLRFSRLSSAGLEYSEFDPTEMIGKIQFDLRTLFTNKRAQIFFSSLPRLRADRNLIDQLFRNLISNAIKFNQNATPTIVISAGQERDQLWFSLKDNGIGIPSADIPRLFKPFARLHSRDIYEGDGIGLSLCQRIVLRHGGAIWIDSREGEGSDVRFTLPA